MELPVYSQFSQVELICPACQGAFRVKRALAKRRTYCCRECYLHSRSPAATKPCEYCGAKFTIVASRAASARFCSDTCRWAGMKGEPKPTLNKGGYITRAGYRIVYRNGEQHYEHRLVMERYLGRKLTANEHIHHLGDKADNRIEMLQLVTNSEHGKLHNAENPWARQHGSCVRCGTIDFPHEAHGLCEPCYRQAAYDKVRVGRYEWSLRYPCCVECGTTERPHNAHGLCAPCYKRRYR